MLAPGLKGAKLGADRILLRENKATPIVLLRSDDEIQNRLKYTIDGDAQAMRTLLRWLCELIRVASLDGHFEIIWPFGQAKERRSIREWLTFGWEDHPFDWRCSRDLIEDQNPYWDADDVYLPPLSPAKQARVRDVEIPTYHRFYRAVVDPSFVGKADGRGQIERAPV